MHTEPNKPIATGSGVIFIFLGGQTHPLDLGTAEVERFLADLAANGEVAAATQRQTLNANVFLYREVLDKPWMEKSSRYDRKKQELTTALGQEEIRREFRYIVRIYMLIWPNGSTVPVWNSWSACAFG